MTLTIQILLFVALVLSILVPGTAFMLGEKNRGRFKTMLAVNLFTFFGLLLISVITMFAGAAPVFADETQTMGSGLQNSGLQNGLGYIAAALSTGISCLGGGIAVASAASAALGAISEDQSILGKSLIYVGLAEGVCLYGLIISFMIIGQLG